MRNINSMFSAITVFIASALLLNSHEVIAQYQEEIEEPAAEVPNATPTPIGKAEEKKEEEKKAASAAPEAPPEPPNTAILLGLNKVTARTEEIMALVGESTRFGTLEIIVRACNSSPPDKLLENAALMEIWQTKPDKAPEQIYSGWMFSSTPGLMALEHPVYDITVKECVYAGRE